MQLQLNHTPVRGTELIPASLKKYAWPDAACTAWTDGKRSILLQEKTLAGSRLQLLHIELQPGDHWEIGIENQKPLFLLALQGKCEWVLSGEMPQLITESRFGTGFATGSAIRVTITEERRFQLIALELQESLFPFLNRRPINWYANAAIDTRTADACKQLIAAAYLTAASGLHHALINQISDTVLYTGYDSGSYLLYSVEEIYQFYSVKAFAALHLRDPFNTGHIAQVFGLAKEKLVKGFTALFGISLYRFVEQQRMELAKQLLLTHRTLKEIARLCAYRNVSNFTTAFKRNTGYTPAVYRKSFRKQSPS